MLRKGNQRKTGNRTKGLIVAAVLAMAVSVVAPAGPMAKVEAVMAEENKKVVIQGGAPLDEFDTTTPDAGQVNALIFKVNFQDVKFDCNTLSASELEKAVFGRENVYSVFYPMESVSAYYQRASYGNLFLDGKVYAYQAKHKRTYYSNKKEFETLAMEVLNTYDKYIDYSKYDRDKDGYIDCLTLSVPVNGASEDDFWYGCQASWYLNPSYQLDGVKVKAFIINDEQPYEERMDQYNATLAHEIGHSMGLPDYYKYSSENDWEGLKGEAGAERMDDGRGDFCSFSKLMYGWIPKEQIQVADFSSGAGTYTLSSASDTGNCLLIPVGTLKKQYFGEYFLVEYVTPTKNNAGLFQEGGIRVFHVNAKTMKSAWGSTRYKMFRYENYSPDYDTSNEGIRILKLVGEEHGFYQSGESISYGTSQFVVYDQKGKAVIDPGFCIQIGPLADGKYQVTIQK